jgi:hypothetical protein
MFFEVVRIEHQQPFQMGDVTVRVKELIHDGNEVFGEMGDVKQL